jgi:RNA polymerase sigma factor (sigma-70 family)
MTNLAARMSRAGDRDDIVQEALTRAWKRRSTYDPARGSPRVWLLAIVADQARRAHRRMRLTPWVPRPAVQERPTAEGLDLERAISRLPNRQRLAVDLYYFVGLDVAETAAVMRCAPGTVKSTLADARAHLRRALEEG